MRRQSEDKSRKDETDDKGQGAPAEEKDTAAPDADAPGDTEDGEQEDAQEAAQAGAPSGLAIEKLGSVQHRGSDICPGHRIWLTADKTRLVPEGHPDAATLYCTETDRVPLDEFEALVEATRRHESGE